MGVISFVTGYEDKTGYEFNPEVVRSPARTELVRNIY